MGDTEEVKKDNKLNSKLQKKTEIKTFCCLHPFCVFFPLTVLALNSTSRQGFFWLVASMQLFNNCECSTIYLVVTPSPICCLFS